MTTVLVTGGAGYIGSHVARQLRAEGLSPVVLDNLSSGHRHAVRWGPLVVGDVADKSLLRRTLSQHHVTAIMHFAGAVSVAESVADPKRYFNENVLGAARLLEAALAASIKICVFSSSAAVYGATSGSPISEDHPLLPVSPYGETKMFVERMLRSYGRAYDWRWVALRYFNAAGAAEDGSLGEEHQPETHLIPLAIRAALGGPPLQIYGADYPTPDGTAIRDYVHVEDLADAHVKALRYLLDGGESAALNLGAGRGHSVTEVVKAVERAAGRTVPTIAGARRDGDPEALVADTSRAQTVLGWRAERSGIDAVVSAAWRFANRQRPA